MRNNIKQNILEEQTFLFQSGSAIKKPGTTMLYQVFLLMSNLFY